MKKALNGINQAASDCGACNVTACESCIPSPARATTGMRITYGFHRRIFKLPVDQLKRERPVFLNTCIYAIAVNPRHKETSEAGLAALVLC